MFEDFHVSDVVVTTGLATLATTAAALHLSKKEVGHGAAALNATSHIVWGDRAFDRDAPDVRHTLLGGLLNASAMASWAAVQALLFSRPRTLLGAAASGAAVSALAYVTDYHVVPRRLTPGFEARLSSRNLFAIYAVLAAALGAGAHLAGRRRR